MSDEFSSAPALDALALLELDSIARGYRALDALAKEAPVRVVHANLVEPGKFLILFGGGVAETESAFAVGRAVAGECLLDEVLLPFVDARIWAGLRGACTSGEIDTVGVVEGSGVAPTIAACDHALKTAAVDLGALRVVTGLGGKAFFVVQGVQHDVEAAIDAAVAVLSTKLVRAERIARPHPDFLAHLLRPSPFGAY